MRTPLGVGVDIVAIPQLEAMLTTGGAAFRQLCWTADELAYCAGSTPRLAARWAAKEATMKALGRGIGAIAPTDIEVAGREGQPPTLRLHGPALAAAQEQEVDLALSMSHEAHLAIAFVVATPRRTGECGRCHLEGGSVGTE
ncbi:holo-ACP synthase [Blastococcus sp. CT_GayMR20]|uniref:holo-ACP synthase n=1 Tax=Blastococcus sp. CT_GayMR20 TaxID=2559609 RepID=UPI0010739934|nr:holo-ACP synthase [Blastococcus sp. CT_GayMR20]TFV88121.1 holo-ACP synthase [Blastococcus sp. CT_GayMR20]